MIKLNRRETLALGGGTFLSELLLGGAFASAQTSDTLTIAYNVNLPSFDPTVGLSAVNPTIQSIYRPCSIIVGQTPDLSFKPGPHHQMGLERGPEQDLAGLAQGRDLARRLAGDARRRRVVAATRGRPEERQPDPVRLVRSRQLQGRRQYHRCGCLAFEPTLFKWMAFLTAYVLPKAYYEKVGAEGLREGSDRLRPLQGRCLPAQCVPPAEGESGILGPEAGVRDGDIQVRH